MPRRPRVILPNVPAHIIQRGNNRQACFLADADYRFYLERLQELATAQACRVHAFVLMTNHVHLLLTADTSDGPGQLMKRLGQRHAQYINRTYQRSGTLWEGRYRSCLVQEDTYLLACYRYIELNPVRAGMVAHPADYPWSSYRVNAEGEDSAIVSPHALYERLGRDPVERRQAYRELFRHEPGTESVDAIRHATNGNYVLGGKRFESEVEASLGRRVTPAKAGRPKTS